jgi:hypothetical protein
LITELYLHGLAEGDFDLVLRGLWGVETCKMLLVAEKISPLEQLMKDVHRGARYVNGVSVNKLTQEEAA